MVTKAEGDFVHLHVHSDYSLLDGACRLDYLLGQTKALGMNAIAVTDHGNLFGAPEFYNLSSQYGIKPLIGCETYYVFDHKRTEKPERSQHKIHHCGLIATNFEGYQNLSRIVSEAHTTGFYYKPRADMELLACYSKGLICLSGCMNGVVASYLLEEQEEKAYQAAGTFIDIFGKDHYFVEVQDHGMEEQKRLAPRLFALAKKFDLRTVVTNDVHYVKLDDWAVHDELLCIQTGTKIKEEKRMRFPTRQFYLKSATEMGQLFPDHPEVLSNTRIVADMCDVKLPFGKNNYPVFPLSDDLKKQFGSIRNYAKHLCTQGLQERYGVNYERPGESSEAKVLVQRLDYELSIIEKTGFLDYFLIVWDFIHWAREKKIPVGPGRGSGAGCLVAYLLKITDIDPIRFKLLFERFLNPERVSPPDFDIDFCMRRRGEVVEYVKQKYGECCVAHIITFGTFGAKMVIRDLARVNDVPYVEADRLAKMVPDDLGITLKDALEKSKELKNEVKSNPLASQIIQHGSVIEGMVRNTGTHAAGIIITDRPITELVPVTLQEGVLTTQYPKDPLESMGLLKMDFLGLKTLTVIDDCQQNIRRTRSLPKFDIEKVPLEDPAAFALLNEGRTIGVFQLESPGMQNLCRQFSIANVDEISALSALYRPGPMEWIPDYVRGKKDPASVKFVHPLLENISRETYGILVYQEQVMEAAKLIAGYSLGGADILRRAMGKKKIEVMNEQRAIFVKGAKETNSIDSKTAEEIFNILEKFAGYGFNKSHSSAYAIITYHTAYLKANYPVEYMAALLSSELGNADKLAHFIEECTAMNLPVLGPDINASFEAFTPVLGSDGSKGCIRFGLAGIKGVGDTASRSILQERAQNGLFKDFFDFVSRTDSRVVNKRVLECLIRSGSFDPTGIDRQHLLDSIDAVLSEANTLQKDRQKGQVSLFELAPQETNLTPAIRTQGALMEPIEKLKSEKELLGFYVSGHPLNVYAGLDTALQSFKPEELELLPNNEGFRLCGILGGVEKKISKKDNRLWAIFQLSTRTQTYSLNAFPEAFEKNAQLIRDGLLVVVHGSVRKQESETRLNVNRIYRLDDKLPSLLKSCLWILKPDDSAIDFLKCLQEHIRHYPGSTAINIAFETEPKQMAYFDTSFLRCAFDAASYSALRKHPAVIGVQVEVAEVPDPPQPSWKKN